MDLKEMVLIALTEIGEESANGRTNERSKTAAETTNAPANIPAIEPAFAPAAAIEEKKTASIEQIERIAPIAPIEPNGDCPPENSREIASEAVFLAALRERVLTLFEGFESPNNRAIEAKIDLTLNFFEYLLSAIDERLEKLQN